MTDVSRTDQPPFQLLLDEHGAVVLRLLVVLVGRQDAPDAWQDTFAKAWAAYPSLTDASNLRGWLLTIARRTAVDVHRVNGRRPVAVPIDDAAPIDGSVMDVAVAQPDVEYDADLWRRVDALPPKQRLAVVYRYVADLAYVDIAALMECSVEAARRSAHEGVRRLRQEVAV